MKDNNSTWIEPFNFSDKYRAELIQLFIKWIKSESGADLFIRDLEAGVESYKTSEEFSDRSLKAVAHREAIKDLRSALDTLSGVAKTTDRNTLNWVRDEFVLKYDENPCLLELIKSGDWVKQIIGLKISCDEALGDINPKVGDPGYLAELHLVDSIAGAFKRFDIKGKISKSGTSRGAQVLKIILLDLKHEHVFDDDGIVDEDKALTTATSILRRYLSQN